MSLPEINKVVLIGSGNLATHLGRIFTSCGIRVLQVWSNKEETALLLARETGARPITLAAELTPMADLYIIAVPDRYVEEILPGFPFLPDHFVVHTSGSLPMDVLKEVTKYTGVFYPLQTFSKERPIDFKTVPVCIECKHKAHLRLLSGLAHKITNHVYPVSSEQRRILHLAAVFAGNFSNFMYAIAEYLLVKNDLPFEMVKPLIAETANKIKDHSPGRMQTGPAVRNDQEVIAKHLEMLEEDRQLKEIYQIITDTIVNLSHSEKNGIRET